MFDATFSLSFSDLDSIARQSGLVVRHSYKFSGSGFLFSLLRSVIKGDASRGQLAMQLGSFQSRSMSRQAMHKRFPKASGAFLTNVHQHLITEKSRSVFEGLESAPFKRVLIEDPTIIPMAKSNAVNFPNNGRVATAGCKCLLLTDRLSGDVLTSDLHNARDSDQALADNILEHCRAEDLVVRDMGFFNLDALHEFEKRKAFWVSRLPASVSLTTADGTELRDLLKQTHGNRIDRTVIVGRDARRRVSCRLVATRLKQSDAANSSASAPASPTNSPRPSKTASPKPCARRP